MAVNKFDSGSLNIKLTQFLIPKDSTITQAFDLSEIDFEIDQPCMQEIVKAINKCGVIGIVFYRVYF